MLPRDRSDRSLNAQTLFRKRNQLIEKACSNFWYLASCIHHLVFVAAPKTARNSAEYEHAEGETKLDTESWRD